MAYTDAFTGTPDTTLGSPWVSANSLLLEYADNGTSVHGNGTASTATAYYNNTFADAHYSYVIHEGDGSNGAFGAGVAVRMQSGADSYFYAHFGFGGHMYIGQQVAGSGTDWEDITASADLPTAGQVWGLRVNGTTVEYVVNGVVRKTYTGKNALSGGRGGVIAYAEGEGSTVVRLASWEGGDLTTSYTLSADSGSFTETGVAAALLKASKLTASTGSFSLTGQNTTLNYSGSPSSTYTLTTQLGQFTLNGYDSELLFSVANYLTWDRVAGNEGYRIEWGQTSGGPYPNSSDNTTNDETITLVLPYRTTWYARVASLVGGTPQDWSSEIVFTSGIPDLNADVETFTLTGNGANLLRGYTLTANTGVFTLTGNNTNLLIQRTLPAATGSFTLTGNDINLNRVASGTYTLVAETGSFALTGVDANLLYNRTLLADVGSFTLTGINTGLLYSNAPVSQYKHRQLHVCMSISL